MTIKQPLQAFLLHDSLRRQFWLEETPVTGKLFGSLDHLQWTAALVQRTGASISASEKRKIC